MSDWLNELQALRSKYEQEADIYGRICKAVAKAVFNTGEVGGFTEIMAMVATYGAARRDAGYWHGVISQRLNVVELPSEAEAREYAKAAAAAGQQDLLDGPDPDDPRGLADHLDDLSSGRDPSPVESAGTG